MQNLYKKLISINKLKLDKKKILILGGGQMSESYVQAALKLGIKQIVVISKSEKSKEKFLKSGVNFLSGGYEINLKNLDLYSFDLIIVSLPIKLLKPATINLLKKKSKTILVEKPFVLYSNECNQFKNKKNLFIAFNRMFYPNIHLVKKLTEQDGGITSCRFEFTEWIHQMKIDYNKFDKETYSRWGVAHSIHLISLVNFLIGFPKIKKNFVKGTINWHKTGNIFVGSGVSDKGIPYSYHANWGSSGRWGIEIMTKKGIYKLAPIEQILFCPKGSVDWMKIEAESTFPEVKAGVAELLAVLLDKKLGSFFNVTKVEELKKHLESIENIFNYKSSN